MTTYRVIFLVLLGVFVAFFPVHRGAIASAQDGAVKSWQRELIKRIQEVQEFPRSALTRKIEGVAHVKVTLAADGAIRDFELVKKTGYSVFDRQIPGIMRRLTPLPAPPKSLLKSGEVRLKLPLVWRIG